MHGATIKINTDIIFGIEGLETMYLKMLAPHSRRNI